MASFALAPLSNFTSVAIIVGITFSLVATAKNMTDSEYQFLENNIEIEYTAAKLRCNSASTADFAKCIAEAESNRNASKSELNEKRKIIVSSRSDSLRYKQTQFHSTEFNYSNEMPIVTKLNPAHQQSRLI